MALLPNLSLFVRRLSRSNIGLGSSLHKLSCAKSSCTVAISRHASSFSNMHGRGVFNVPLLILRRAKCVIMYTAAIENVDSMYWCSGSLH